MSTTTRKVVAAGALAGALLLTALAGLHAWLIDGLDGWLWSLTLDEDTAYTPGYSDAAFRRVHPGMTIDEVHKLLGPPQLSWAIPRNSDGEDTGERWSWSPGDTNFRCRVILFGAGRVIEKHAELYID